MSESRGNIVNRMLWRMQFKIVPFIQAQRDKEDGRCVKCDARPEINKKSCCEYGCPCDMNQQLKRRS